MGTEDPKGSISTEHTVWCGDCVKWVQMAIGHMPSFKQAIKKEGWKNTKARGWLCRKCSKLPENKPQDP